MKKLFLLISLTAISLTSTAQYRKMLLDTSHYWQQKHNACFLPNPCLTCDFQLKVKKDSVVNGKIYKYIKTIKSYCNDGSNFSESALLREDTLKKIILTLLDNEEKILYNFNKNVGDTALLYTANGMQTFTLSAKDSILISDGLYHKRYLYDFGQMEHIEGVGGNFGLLTPWTPFEIWDELLCLIQTSPSFTTNYSAWGLGTTCPLLTNIFTETGSEKIISLFPNPSSDNLNIITESVVPKFIEIKNVLGQTIFFTNHIHQGITTINIKDFSQGVYFITVDLGDKHITGHFIKN